MNVTEIRQLSDAFEVGAHTVHHTVLPEVSDEIAEREIRDSKNRLEDLTGRSSDAFCFPKGRFQRRHLDMVSRAGFRCARSVELLSIQFPARRAGIAVIPTTVQSSLHSWKDYVRNSAKRLSARNIVNFTLYARSRNWTEIARSMLAVVAQHGGIFHLWGHSWEIEEQQQWLQLESLFHDMQRLRSTAPCVPNSSLVT